MQEISPRIYIETNYAGVTLGVIKNAHGLVLIDVPFLPQDIRLWRSSLLNMGGGANRLMVNLDAHYDRTIGARALDCAIVGHSQMAEEFENRSVSFKANTPHVGAEWELYEGVAGVRWAAPEITFSERLTLRWDENPILLNHYPGPTAGSIWVDLPEEQVLFIGDHVIADQPPFLADADLSQWIENLDLLMSPKYQDYLIVSGRSGLIYPEQIGEQKQYLEKVKAALDSQKLEKQTGDRVKKLIPDLLEGFQIPAKRKVQYELRLEWGLSQYIKSHFLQEKAENE
ncbi:MAG: hypothetical protein JEZ06_05165 [Anaerolineaceae bacterium]|nr:hypothetical protein [Anaerolineaceae bacterium]